MAANNMEPGTKIQYFVFMKAETTDRTVRSKIVALSMIAVNRQDLERGQLRDVPVEHKILVNMVFNPECKINDSATKAHGISDSNVKNAPSFGQRAGDIVEFLQQFPKPVCLVAHNGFSFDYKHLQSECNEAKIQLPHDLHCADARYIFYDIMKTAEIRKPKVSFSALKETFVKTKVDPVLTEDKVLMLIDFAMEKNPKFLYCVETKTKLFSAVSAYQVTEK